MDKNQCGKFWGDSEIDKEEEGVDFDDDDDEMSDLEGGNVSVCTLRTNQVPVLGPNSWKDDEQRAAWMKHK